MPEPFPRARSRRSRALAGGSAAAVFLPVPAILAACGGSSAGPVDAAAAKAQLVAVADRLDACYAKRGDTRKCKTAEALGDVGDAKLGNGTGEVVVIATKPTRYQLTMKVDDRTTFAILVQPVGARKRVCTPSGENGCLKGGKW